MIPLTLGKLSCSLPRYPIPYAYVHRRYHFRSSELDLDDELEALLNCPRGVWWYAIPRTMSGDDFPRHGAGE